MKNSNWSTPKTNILAGMLDLRKALASGQNAVLVKARNEDCTHPIRVKIHDEDFRNYQFSSGHVSSREEIRNDNSMSEFDKYLSMNYKACYGTQEAVNRYYESGLLSADNFKGYGTCHLVKVKDMIAYLKFRGNNELAENYIKQYLSPEAANQKYFFDFYRYKHGSPWAIKEFKKKLWVVQLLNKDEKKASIPTMVKVLNTVLYPLKYVPRKSVLKMDEYTNITYRIGGITNGFSIEFQIPKKFDFK